ncbi:RTA1 like protein-domain-containing protein [Truncatella angustata]|uniref:RTA1 like protein-domain-containing protein n=1 Tax=Truncatella angustata TaxID=152316 RepID=A0A9P8UM91_9PEZI|nr:RTA1 like protein-domain-containing protein [Truncatella angustata]KAH6654763.1 RTA1 like protein-domain-containing protein [Truncatella angustata]
MTVPDDYVPGFVCQLGTCDVEEWGYVHYQPSIPGNALFLAIIVLFAICQLALGIYYKTGLMAVSILLGLATEALGYIARILLHTNPFDRAYFLWYLICLTIGPVFIAAAIYLSLGRIVVVYGEDISRIKPRTYTIIFMGCDIISLCIQAVGGGIAASTPITNQTMIDLGTHVLIAGLSFQVASLFAFTACSLEFLWRVKKYPGLRNPEFADLVNSKRFKLFLCSLFIATTLLFIRTVFRSVELSEGFSGKLANNEVQFMILDGVMVILATMCITVWHPGYGFQKRWNDARFRFRTPKAIGDQEDPQSIVAGGSEGSEKVEPMASEAVAVASRTHSQKC